MTIETLKLGKKMGVRKKGIYNANRIVWIQRSRNPIPDIPDGGHVARCNVARRTYKCKIFHLVESLFLFEFGEAISDMPSAYQQPFAF